MNNSTYFRFSEELSSGSSGQQHSTMTEPDFTNFDDMSSYDVKEENEDHEMEGEEPEFYYEADDEQGCKVEDSFDVQDQANDDRLQKCYTLEDFTPTVRDPRCTIDSNELAYLWPVYVSNFRSTDRGNQVEAAKAYFASKGLYVRWCCRPDEGKFSDFQRTVGIYDMLVYFISERDANRAIEQCHRDVHREYTLNVFPGRVAAYFDPARSVKVWKEGEDIVYSEQFYENNVTMINPKPQISCTVKFDILYGAIEFASREDMTRAMNIQHKFRWARMSEPLQKQRFLERDLTREIRCQLAWYPNALRFNPNDKYVQMLMNGIRPSGYVKKPKPKPGSGKPTEIKGYRKQKQYILKALTEGRTPLCHYKDALSRQVFYSMVRTLKKRLTNAMKKNQDLGERFAKLYS